MTHCASRLALLLLVIAPGCSRAATSEAPRSAYPIPVEPARVGSYPALTKSGGGYFYDEVLEYRVWVHPESGGDDLMNSFKTFEDAEAFSRKTKGAEPPLVLVRQREWLDEPSKGVFERKSGERLTEWQVPWLARGARQGDTIDKFLAEHAAR